MIPHTKQLTQHGIELGFSCYIGHFYLTNLLLDYLKNAQPSRIINVSSGFHKFGSINLDDINFENNFHPEKAYIQTKIANIMHSKYLQKQLDQQKINIKIVSLHPGVIRTEIGRNRRESNLFQKLIVFKILYAFSQTPLQGAQTTLHCSLIDYDNLIGGAYYSNCSLSKSSAESCDDKKIQRLWKLSQNLIEKAIKNQK